MKAVIFPGQGSQSPGMGKFLFDNFEQAKLVYEEASDAISVDMKKLCFEADAEELSMTENTQPAIVTTSIAMFRSLNSEKELTVHAFAGHSVGEYAAVVAAGALPFDQSVKAVRHRGAAMQSAVPVGLGGMLAIVGPSSEDVVKLCKWTKEQTGADISAANFNSPTQTVVSGEKKACDWLTENIKTYEFATPIRRLMAVPLQVSAPFHCAMMAPAEERMKLFLGDCQFSDASIPVVQNVTADGVTAASELCENLVQQITGSVRWVESIKEISQQGVNDFLECGTGKVLAGLNKKMGLDLKTANINSLEEFKAFLS